MTITTLTLNGVDYISYASLAELNAILDVDPVRGTAWRALSDDQKREKAIAATYRLDILPWRGEKAGGASQEHAWPRADMTYADGTAIGDDEIPLDLVRAEALLAGSITSRPSHAEQGGIPNQISEIRAGPVQIKYANPEQSSTPVTALQDETAYQLVRQWLRGRGAGSVGAIATGTDQQSAFLDRNQYGYRYPL